MSASPTPAPPPPSSAGASLADILGAIYPPGTQNNNSGPVVGPAKPPPIPAGGAFGTPGSPGSISYPPGTIGNQTGPGFQIHGPSFGHGLMLGLSLAHAMANGTQLG